MSQYRFCISDMAEMIRKIKPPELRQKGFITNEIFYVQGPLRHHIDALASILIDGSFNYSLTPSRELCVSSLHRNASDIMFCPANLSVNDELIDIYAVIGQSKLHFQSSYNYTEEAINTNVLDSIISFKPSLWMLILFWIFPFAWLMQSRRRTCSHKGTPPIV